MLAVFVLLMCGGGRSNTNMMLGSDLMANDAFLRLFEKGADIAEVALFLESE